MDSHRADQRSSARLRPPTGPSRGLAILALALAVLPACRTHRVLEITSEPEGALVRLDEEVVGHTPTEVEFYHYGRRRLTLYVPGHRAWSRRIEPRQPWYSTFPMDFVTEVLLPLGLEHRYDYHAVLVEDTGTEEETGEPAIDAFLDRAARLRAEQVLRALGDDAENGGAEDGEAEEVPEPDSGAGVEAEER